MSQDRDFRRKMIGSLRARYPPSLRFRSCVAGMWAAHWKSNSSKVFTTGKRASWIRRAIAL